jgi:asparagine synthase (glutamine-hydrolysing)
LADVNDFVVAMEEPVTSLSAYAQYRVFKLAHEHGAKVLLDGQGGDEIFAGYVYYFGYHFYDLFTKFKWYALAKEMIMCFKKLGGVFPHAMFLFLLLPDQVRYAVWKKMISPWINHEFLEQVCGGEKDPRWRRMGVKESLSKTLFSTSIPHNLMWEDKSSMRWSIESRVPFLDVALVETALSLDPGELLKNGETKLVFKKALSDILPEMIRDRKDKIGFVAPMDDFFRDDGIVAFAREIIYSDKFKQRPYWRWTDVEKLFVNHVNRKTNAGATIWKCINLELWLREFVEKRVL